VIVDCAHYKDGVRQNAAPLSLEEVTACRSVQDSFVWLGLREPERHELDAVQARFDLHELAVEDAQNAHQRPKLEEYEDSRFLVLHTARYDDQQERVHFGEVHMFVGRDYVITIRHGEASDLHPARERLEAHPQLLKLGPASVVWAVLDKIVDDYEPVVDGLENDIEEVQSEIFGIERGGDGGLHEWDPDAAERRQRDRTPGGDPTGRVYFLIREVTEFRRAVLPLLAPLEAVERGSVELDPEIQRYFRDVNDHVKRVTGQIRDQAKLLDSILQANLALVSVRQNEVVKKISAWAAMIAVPTFIASIYGMNFDNMPELKWHLGYPLSLAFMVLIGALLYRYFKRADWI
jgi:magnesium transporter